MKTSKVDLSNLVQTTYKELNNFHGKLQIGIVSDKEVKAFVDFLHKESTILNRELIHTDELKDKIIALDPKLKSDFLDLVHSILKSPTYMQVLGQYQKELSNLLNRMEQNIGKWHSKVERVENDPLNR